MIIKVGRGGGRYNSQGLRREQKNENEQLEEKIKAKDSEEEKCNKKNNTISFSAASQNALSILRKGEETFESHDVGGIPVGIELGSSYETVDLVVEHDSVCSIFPVSFQLLQLHP